MWGDAFDTATEIRQKPQRAVRSTTAAIRAYNLRANGTWLLARGSMNMLRIAAIALLIGVLKFEQAFQERTDWHRRRPPAAVA